MPLVLEAAGEAKAGDRRSREVESLYIYKYYTPA